jgi:hypothetical protein
MVSPMAAQVARLLAGSELDELRQIVRRWAAEAETSDRRRQYEDFGARLIELKVELARSPIAPTLDELEAALTMMLELAARHSGGPFAQ